MKKDSYMKTRTEIVDDKDNVLGTADYSEIYSKPLWHRISAILIFDENNNIFLQKRSKDKAIEPGKWDFSIAGHLDIGETYKMAAKREAKEELGISGIKIKEIKKFKMDKIVDYLFRKEFVMLYFSKMNKSEIDKFSLDKKEVEMTKFFKIDEIDKLTKTNKNDFTAAFLLIWPQIQKELEKL